MKIETNDLIIRNFELSDEKDLCEYMLQRVNAEFEQYPDFTCEKVKKEVEFRAKSDEFYAIELKKEHKVIGNIYLGNRNFNTRELGYVLNEHYQNKGYGSDASKAIIEYMFRQGIHRIYAECAPQNTPSWKLMEKIGMKREAHFRKNVSFRQDKNGHPIYWDTYVYALLNPYEEILMKPYISQPKGSMSCGAYSIAYYLWESNKVKHVNDKTFVDNIYKKIQVGSNNIGIPEAYSSPEKMSKELSDNWKSYSRVGILSNSPIMQLAKELNIPVVNMNVLDKVKSGTGKYAIILCSSEKSARALHYILIKYEDNTFKMLNSSAVYGNGIDNVVWEKFIIEPNGKLTLKWYTPYIYTGAGILIE